MSFDYSRLSGTADRMVERFGRSVDLTPKLVGTGLDPGSTDGPTHTVRMVEMMGEVSKSDDALTASKTRSFMAGTLPVTPQIGDTILDGGVTFKITKVKTLKPGSTEVMHKITSMRS